MATRTKVIKNKVVVGGFGPDGRWAFDAEDGTRVYVERKIYDAKYAGEEFEGDWRSVLPVKAVD